MYTYYVLMQLHANFKFNNGEILNHATICNLSPVKCRYTYTIAVICKFNSHRCQLYIYNLTPLSTVDAIQQHCKL